MAGPSKITSDQDKSRQELIAELESLRAQVSAGEGDTFAGEVSAGLIGAALDATPALIAYVDRSMRYRYVNRTYTTWFGVPAGEIVGKRVDEFLDSAGYAAVSEVVTRVMKGETVTHRNVLEVAECKKKYIEARLVPQIDDAGEVAGYFSMAFDISDRIEAEDALRLSEERYRSLVEISPDAVYLHRNFELVFVNAAGADDPEELIGQDLNRFIDPSDHPLARQRYESLLKGVPQPRQEFLMRRLDGSNFHVRSSMTPITWKGDAAVMIMT